MLVKQIKLETQYLGFESRMRFKSNRLQSL